VVISERAPYAESADAPADVTPLYAGVDVEYDCCPAYEVTDCVAGEA
jgi:hypothetical protein